MKSPAVIFNAAFDTAGKGWKIGGWGDYNENEIKYVQKAFEEKYEKLGATIFKEDIFAEKLCREYDYFDYMGNKAKSVGIFTASKDVCNDDDLAVLRDYERHALKSGITRYRAVCSFDNDFLITNDIMSPSGLIDYKKLRGVARTAMNTLIDKTQKLDNDNVVWCSSAHTNTDNVHLHFEFFEKEKRPKKGAIFKNGDVLELEALDAFKLSMVKSITKSAPLSELTNFQRKVLLPSVKTRLESPSDKVVALANILPDNKNLWQYGRKALDGVKTTIDDTVMEIIRSDPDCYQNYKDFMSQLDSIEKQYLEWFGDGIGEYTYYDEKKGSSVTKEGQGRGLNLSRYMKLNYQNQLKKDLGNALLEALKNNPGCQDSKEEIERRKAVVSEDVSEVDSLPDEEVAPPFSFLSDESAERREENKGAKTGAEWSSITAVEEIGESRARQRGISVVDEETPFDLNKIDFRDNDYRTAKQYMREARSKGVEPEEKEKLLEAAAESHRLSAINGNIPAALAYARAIQKDDPDYGDLIYSACFVALSEIEETLQPEIQGKFSMRGWADYNIAKMYEYGNGVDRSKGNALNWYLKGDSEMCRYGAANILYYGADKIKPDPKRAFELLYPIEDNGYVSLMKGNIYERTFHDDTNAQKEFGKALTTFLKMPDEDKSIDVWYQMGKIYFRGLDGKKPNLEKARECLQKGVDENVPKAILLMGELEMSVGNTDEALRLWQSSFNKGNSQAAEKLGKYHYNKGDYEMSVEYLTKSADEGSNSSQYLLGKAYHRLGDRSRARKYYSLAAENENQYAQYSLGKLYTESNEQERAERYFTLSANNGNEWAQYQLGRLYATQGKTEQAFAWLSKSADESDNSQAQYMIGKMYLADGAVTMAQKYLMRSCEQGNVNAAYLLGKVFTPNDINKAIDYFTIAADNGNQYAQYNLGKIYAEADNFDKAEQYLLQSAESGLTQAKTLLGELYMSSENDENINKAFNWLHSAADEDDDKRAQYLLANLYRRSGDMTHYEEYIKKSGYKKPGRSRKKAPMIKPRIRQQSMSAMSVIRHVQIQQEIHTNKILSQFESDFNAQVAKRRYENEHGITLG